MFNMISTAAAELERTATATLPPTETQAVKEMIHGVEVVDPFRWLEGSAAPELTAPDPELDARVSRWTDSQNAHTRELLSSLPGRQGLEERLAKLMQVGQVRTPRMRGDHYFYWERRGDQPQWTVRVRQGANGESRVLLDPNALDEEGLTALGWFSPSPDGTLGAFGLFRSGDENTTLYVLEVATGSWLADEIPGKVNGLSWLPDSRGFLYHCLAEADNPYSTQIKLHRLGTHHRQDPLIFEQYKEGPLATTWGPFAGLSDDARWMLLGYWTGTGSHDLWVVDFDRWQRTGELVRKPILEGEEAMAFGEIVGDTAFLRTTLDAPNGRVVAVDLNDPRRERWRDIIPERSDAVLEDISVARGILVAEYLKDASSRIERFRYDGEPLGELKLPGLGSAGVAALADRTEAFLTYSSFNQPSTIYHIDLESGERKIWAQPEVPVDPALVEVHQVWYPSKDGTKVSMFLVHRKGLARNGNNPTLLYGYGGFNVPMTPAFRATLFPWFEAGGVYAIANLRGGGEYGEAWHQAGMLARKQNVFDDFIAAGEWLTQNGYTNPKRLAVSGGSNGGLLTGAVLVQRPDLFTAVVSEVPLLDMVRYQNFLMARFWVPEYGSSENADQLPFLLKYSPYHNIEKGVRYPAVLLTAGENDSRVHPLHARKMAAALQAATASDPEVDPILLWVDRSAGHGQGKPLRLQIESTADELIFLMWQTGLLKG